MIVLIDTCVIIDVLQKREPFWEDSYEIFLLAAQDKIDARIAAKSITDIYYITHRVTHSDDETRKIILKLLDLFDLADTTALDCKNALFSSITDFEDAVLEETAKRENAAYIITRNLKDYAKSKIKALSPTSFLTLLNTQ